MEKKTIGAFIAALRKANGLTQKQLAEKLNVSDKAVSRWERDECAPDLSLIPVLAEIFGVTSDEILRGQRRDPDASPTPYEEQKTEKQIQNLLNKTVIRFRMLSAVSLGIAVIGLIAAMICNFGFLRAYIGFGVACIYYVAAMVCQTICTISAIGVISGNTNQDTSKVRTEIIRTTMVVIATIVILICATAPLMLAGDTYYGLTGTSWLQYGAVFTAISTIFCSISVSVITVTLRNKGIIYQTDYQHNLRKLRLHHVRNFLVCCAITLVIFCCVHIFVQPEWFAPYQEFNNWNDFKVYMETPNDYEEDRDSTGIAFIPEPDFQIPDDEYSDTETITRPNGTVLCTYTVRNHVIRLISYGDVDNDYLPIRVYSSKALNTGEQVVIGIGCLVLLLMVPEAIICYISYRKAKKKLV